MFFLMAQRGAKAPHWPWILWQPPTQILSCLGALSVSVKDSECRAADHHAADEKQTTRQIKLNFEAGFQFTDRIPVSRTKYLPDIGDGVERRSAAWNGTIIFEPARHTYRCRQNV